MQMYGKLLMSLQGTRDAAANLKDTYVAVTFACRVLDYEQTFWVETYNDVKVSEWARKVDCHTEETSVSKASGITYQVDAG